MNFLIGGAWPYANGSLHIGHLASLLGGDVLARYYRIKGDRVLYVSGSDCHGTPITLRARKEGVAPGDIAERYHREFEDCFKRLGFSYDVYGHTYSEEHKVFVKDFLSDLYHKNRLYEKQIDQTYCPVCSQFLPDRFVSGLCPHCHKPARGDQCDACGSLLDPTQLIDKSCGICGNAPEIRPTRHLFLALSEYEKALRQWVEQAQGWRANALGMTLRYLDEGLVDRAVTRDIDWGIDVPIEGYEDKKIYVWVEAVLGYLSTSAQAARNYDWDFKDFWDSSSPSLHYYIHGKDNIPFHSVILPALLLAKGDLKLPDRIISSEYENLEGRKISTSGNWAIWVQELLDRYDPDSIRYFFIANGPEKRDADFSWREFIGCHNTDLVNQLGNLVHRTLVFLKKSYDLTVPQGSLEPVIKSAIDKAYAQSGQAIETGNFREALEAVNQLVRLGNRYFDEQKPWVTIKEDKGLCDQSLYNLLQIIANLTRLLAPFTPFAARKLTSLLNLKNQDQDGALALKTGPGWIPIAIPSGQKLNEPVPLFQRLDIKLAEDEQKRLLAGIL